MTGWDAKIAHHTPDAPDTRNLTPAFDKIASGLTDAIAYADGDKTKGCVAARAGREGNWGQDEAEPSKVRGEAAGAGGDGTRLGAAPALTGCASADVAGDGGC